jgi:uncharacterized 2Fe-2S/4Fe-4S cluster protein (DUF4445 family)
MQPSFVIHGGERRPLAVGRSLFDEADEFAVVVPASCRRTGRCHECVVEVSEGKDSLSARQPAEDFLREPYRLACQAVIERDAGDVQFSVLRRRLRILMPVAAENHELDPQVIRAGAEVVSSGEVLDRDDLPVLGLALDVGTTTVVLDLVDLETGHSVATAALENPQRFGGSDVMGRISYDTECPGELRLALRRALNAELLSIYKRLGLDRRAVREVFVVGNPTMRDLFFGLDVAGLGRQPFRSTTEMIGGPAMHRSTGTLRPAHELGLLVHPRARVVGGPIIACHVGADAAADLVAVGLVAELQRDGWSLRDGARGRGVKLVVDIGTNTEIVATDGDRILAASCPAGPAFEGGLVRSGMAGAEGAIESVGLAGGRLTYRTIGDVAPEGICGSGLVDLLAVLRGAGELSVEGRFTDNRMAVQVVAERGIGLSRSDVSHLAQAKAANAAGIRILLRMLDADPADIDTLYLAGGFANSLDIGNSIAIGLLPQVADDRVVRAGNASIRGATELLLSGRMRLDLESLCGRIEHVELEKDPDFFDAFVDGCHFEPMASLRLRPVQMAPRAAHSIRRPE